MYFYRRHEMEKEEATPLGLGIKTSEHGVGDCVANPVLYEGTPLAFFGQPGVNQIKV